jgi:hypothetical protein
MNTITESQKRMLKLMGLNEQIKPSQQPKTIESLITYLEEIGSEFDDETIKDFLTDTDNKEIYEKLLGVFSAEVAEDIVNNLRKMNMTTLNVAIAEAKLNNDEELFKLLKTFKTVSTPIS